MKKRKPIIVYDFDGTLSTYERGWEGAGVCNDPPVSGALEHLVRSLEHFQPAILSSRSHQWGGIPAMKRWLYTHLMALGGCDPQGGQFAFELPWWWADFIHAQSAMEPWRHETWWHETHSASKLVVRSVLWPIFKPPALYTIDDRAHQFDGTWPDHASIAAFKPWNKRVPILSPQAEAAEDKQP